MSDLTIGRRTSGADVVLTPAGEVDMSNAPELRQAVEEALATGARSVTVDLGEVTFVDSTGLAALIGGHRRAAELGITYRVTNPVAHVAQVLDVAGLTKLLGPREAATTD